MKRNLFFLALVFLFSQYIRAQVSTPLVLTGYNADVIAENAGAVSSTNTLEGAFAFYGPGLKSEGAMPATITSRSGVQYNITDFTSNNALCLNNNIVSATLSLVTPIQTKELWVLGTAGSGDINITVKYSDGSSISKKESFPDWYQGSDSKTAYYGLGRVRVNNSEMDDRYHFALFERIIPTDASKTVVGVEFAGENKYTTVFAITAVDPTSRPKDKIVYMIPNSHLDTQWNWTVQTTIDDYVKRTLEGNFALFEKYPNYKFNFEGSIKYKFAKEYYPELFEKLKEYVQAGRWHVSGGSVDANDVMVPSAESIIRNFLYGQQFYKKELGVRGGYDIMLPDCFGFPYSLPTLGAHCGVIGFHSQKLSWGSAYSYDALPNFGLWRGVDGSELLAVHKPGAYGSEGPYRKDISYDGDILNEITSNKQNLGVSRTFRYFGNDGDRGGCVADETANWAEISMAGTGPVTVKYTTPDDFFNSFTAAEKANLPVWDNELPMSTHGVGCYTSQTILKYWNRKNELLADATEKASVFADWTGGLPYQKDVINEAWTNVLWHQFHDDLTGTSLPRAYVFTYNDQVLAQKNLSRTYLNAVGAVSRLLNTNVSGIPIVVHNPLSIKRNDIVEASVELATEPTSISVFAPDGTVVPTQKLSYSEGVLKFIFEAKDVPSLGYATYDLEVNNNQSQSISSTLAVTANTLENDEYKITIDGNGDVSSVYDKTQSKELLKSPIRLSMSYDDSGTWPAWEIHSGDIFRSPSDYVDEAVTVSIAENGPLRAALKITRSKRGSQFVQYARLTSGASADRIDFVNEVDWQTKQAFLKAEFDLVATNPEATFDMSIGTIKRGNRVGNLYEVAGHQWADVTNNDDAYGISILNDCKYGWDKVDDNKIRLTLIHTPKTSGNYDYQQNQDLGLNKFTYSFFRHMGKWNQTTQWEASKLNQPLSAFQTQKYNGSLGKEVDFVSVNTDKVGIKALKKAEESEDMIVRVYELVGESHSNVEITFPATIVSAREVNGVEENVGSVAYTGNKISFPITKYQPKTFAVRLATSTAVEVEPVSDKVALTYNIDVMSNDAKKNDGRFGDTDYAYPAELLSDEIVSDGIKFTIGDRTDGQLNAIKCVGQQITLPQSATNNKLYILAATQSPTGSKADFTVDGKATSLSIDYFAGNVGQFETVYAPISYRENEAAFTATHRHNVSTNKNESYSYLYMYKYMIAVDPNVQKLTLPNNPDIIVFAVTMSDNENDNIKAVSEISHLPKYTDIDSTNDPTPCGNLLMPASVSASGYTNESEAPKFASDGDPYTKWCDNASSNKWIEYSFVNEVEVCQWNVLHAGIESDGMITADFKLQRYDNGSWIDVDAVTGNTDNKTNRFVTPFRTSKIRLYLDRPEQSGGVARIYSLNIYGKETSGIEDISDNDEVVSVSNYPNPFTNQTTFKAFIPYGADNVKLSVINVAGSVVDEVSYPVSENGKVSEFVWNNKNLSDGVYLYTVTSLQSAKTISKQTGKMIIANR